MIKEKGTVEKKKKIKNTSTKVDKSDNIDSSQLMSKEDKIELSKELKINAISIFDRFSFYKDGYLMSLGILIMTIMTLGTSFYFLIYSYFIYQAPNTYLPINEQEQLLEDSPLSQPIYSDNEIRQFATDALNQITDYNYVSVDSTYFSDIRDLFVSLGYKNYKKQFEESPEIKMVKSNYFVVKSNIVVDARLPKKENKEIRKRSNGNKYIWVVELDSSRIYQNQTGFTFNKYKTKMIIMRTKRSENKRGVAIYSIINEKV